MKKKLLQQLMMASKYALIGVFMQTLLTGMLLASEISAQEVKSVREVYVTLKTNNYSVQEILDYVESETDFSFSYYKNEIDLSERIRINNLQQSVYDLLIDVSSKTELSFRQINNVINVKNKEKSEEKEKGVEIVKVALIVTGKVTSGSEGTALPGVNVLVKGSNIGTVTDVDGNYTLNVPNEDDVLVFSSIGYISQEVPVNGRSTIDVILPEDIQSLSEVVVVGYGTQRKGDLTGASVGISSEEIESMPVNSFEQSLSGRVPGVQVTQSNGAPGGGISFKIRGANSITGNTEPLYVIDGVPIISDNNAAIPGNLGSRGEGAVNNSQNALSTLNPNDIADIQVLKDASATSIYGARGANGVVLITTKKGKVGKPSINLDTYVGVQSPTNRLDFVSPEDFVTGLREGFANADQPFPLTDERVDELVRNATDPQDLAFRTPTEASIRNIQLSVSGATDNDLNYYISANNFKQNGIIKNSGFERNSLRFNLEKGFNRIRVGSNFSVSRTDSDIIIGGNRTSTLALISNTSPIQPQFDQNGNYLHETVIDNLNSVSLQSLLDGASDNLVTDRLLGSLFAEYEIASSLTFKSTLGIDVDKRQRKSYYERITGPRFGGTSNPGYGQQAFVNSTQLVSTNTLTYEPELSAGNRLTITGVFEAQTFERNTASIVNRGFTSDVLGADAIGSGQQPGGPEVVNSRYRWQLASWVGRAFYAYQDKYLVNATVRYDGSSRFGENNRWGVFPSIGLGWKMHEEAFLSDIDVLNQLKIRGSYGVTGNQEIGVLRTAERYVPTDGTIFGGVVANTVDAVSFANPNLQWEQSKQYNIGLDAGFLDARLNFTFDYYRRTTSDLLLEVNIAPSTGFSAPVFNAGQIENRGIELALDILAVENADLQWNINMNFSRNRNEVLEILSDRTFGDPVDGNNVPGSLIEEGRPIGMFFGFKTDGVYATQEEADAHVTEGSITLKEAGEYRYVDVNGDNQINADDRTVVGNPNPDFIYGVNSNLRYKAFSLDVFFQGVQGNDILWANAVGLYSSGIGATSILQERFDNRWTPQNTNAEYPKFNRNSDGLSRQYDDRIIFDGSFFRLRNIVLAYELPSTLLERINLQRVRIYTSATNLFTITNYPGFNPDVNAVGQNTVNIGVDQSTYPLAKSFQIGLNVTF
ncbi:TonB-dependent receptor [Catalinimonas sp. 4WD22]|uniref:SusC/RagA family TonB-linked outer membrane protein n=1 Tax=Catalinimonas locisalis TaxID=3133978 RepID=UPI003100EF3D